MKKFLVTAFVLSILFSWTIGPAIAMQIDTYAEYITPASSDSDTDTGVSGVVSSSVMSPGVGLGTIGAGASGDDTGHIAASANFNLATGGSVNDNFAMASVSWSDTYMIADAGNYSWDFNISDGALMLLDAAYTNVMTAGYSISIQVDGDEAWTSAAVLVGGRRDMTFTQNGVELDAQYFEEGYVLGYDFSPYNGSVDLGFLNTGDSFELSYMLDVYVGGPGWEVGAEAAFGDPFDLTGPGTGGVSGELVAAPVPIPGALLLFGPGLAGLLAIRHRMRIA